MNKIEKVRRILDEFERYEPLQILANVLITASAEDDCVEKLKPALGWALLTLIEQTALLAAYEAAVPPRAYAGEVFRLYRQISRDLARIESGKAKGGTSMRSAN